MMPSDATFRAACPHCRRTFPVRVEHLGKPARCPGCGRPFEVVPVVDLGVEPIGLAPEPAAAPTRRPATAHVPQPFPVRPRPSAARPAWLTPVWVTAAVAAAAVVVVLVVAAGLFAASLYRAQTGRVARGQATAAAASPRAAASKDGPPAPKPGAAVPPLRWATDAAGRRVGTADAAVRSARTVVRLVLPPGDHPDRSLPCVFVCPAGSNLLTGVPFGGGEQADFDGLPDRGLAVCFYTLDGTVDDYGAVTEAGMAAAADAYLASACGLANARDAVDTVLAGAAAVDPARLGTMGHSSAGTVALAVAGADPRVAAVAALAPAVDVPARLAAVLADLPEPAVRQLRRASPSAIARLSADVYVYHADDDANTPAAETRAFAAKHPGRVTLARARTGGHAGAYTDGLGPGMDFLAAKLRAAPPKSRG